MGDMGWGEPVVRDEDPAVEETSPPATLDELSTEDLRAIASADGLSVQGLDREDLIELLDEEGYTVADSLVSGPAPSLPPSTNASEIRSRSPVVEPDLPDLDPVTARGIVPRSGMPPNPAADYPQR
jgi:hypothetical protein